MTTSAPRAATGPAPLAPPRDVIIPSPDSTTLRELYGRYLSGVIRQLATFPLARLERTAALELERVRRVLFEAAKREPGLVPALVRDPRFAVLVRCATDDASRPGGRDAASRLAGELCEAIALHLAIAGALPAEGIDLRRATTSLASLPHDLLLRFDAPPRALRFSNGAIAAALDGATIAVDLQRALEAPAGPLVAGVTVERPFPEIRPGVALSLVDNNPLSMLELHPDKSGNALDLGGHRVEGWREMLERAFELVDRYAPEIAGEMKLMLRQIVPVGFDAEKHLSASYAESIGTIYMTLHPSLMTMTEALVHEYQHSKLNTLLFLDPLLENADYPLFTSPVRPDPRPLRGVLLAVHAFQPIARLYEAMVAAGDPLVASDSARQRYQRIAQINHAGCDVLLPNAVPTPIGQGVFDEMRRWDAHFAPVLDSAAAHHAASEDP